MCFIQFNSLFVKSVKSASSPLTFDLHFQFSCIFTVSAMGDRCLAIRQPSGAGELDSLVGSLSTSELSSLQFPFFPGGDEFNSIGLRSDQKIFSEPMHQEKIYQVDFCCQPQQIPEKHFHAEHICAQEEIAHEQEPERNGENFQLLRAILPLSFPAIVIVVPSTSRLVPFKLTTVASRPKIRKMPVDFPEGLFGKSFDFCFLIECCAKCFVYCY